MNALLALLFISAEVVGIISAVHALFTVRTAQGTIAWVIGLIAFPWLALPMYWMFGSRRFDAHSLAMQKKLHEHREGVHAVRAELFPFQVAREVMPHQGVAALAAVADEEFLDDNAIDLLIDGEETYDAVIAAINQAKRSVYVQVYIMREDGLGLRILNAMAAKAAEGVEVCFLFDSFGSAAMTSEIIQKWRDRGVQMATFCAFSGWRDRWRLNFRNHRKIMIIDGMIGFVGGHNIGDEYLGKNPKYGRWRDTHVRVTGPVVMQLQMVFAADWFFATDEIVNANWQPLDRTVTKGNQRALVVSSGPSDDFERCSLFFLNVITMAKSRLWIASPYFVPDEAILLALQLAAIRGVKIRLLLPMKPDQWLVWLASFAMLNELDHPNIEIHRFTGGFLHQKALLVDDDFSAVGTANFDNRSFRLNFEVTLAVSDQQFTADIAKMFERDFAESVMVPSSDYATRPFPFKAAAQAARLLAPIL